jgi:hypothetical protein
MNLKHITTEHNKEALLSFITAAQAGRLESVSNKQQKAAHRLASLLHDLEIELISLSESEVEGFLALVRLSAGCPVWNDQKIRVSMLIAAAVTTPDESGPEYPQSTPELPRWERMQINGTKLTQVLTQLVDEICDPASATIGGKTREEFDAEHSSHS